MEDNHVTNHVKIGGSRMGLKLMFPPRKGLAEFSCNVFRSATTWEPVSMYVATNVLLLLANKHHGLKRTREKQRREKECRKSVVLLLTDNMFQNLLLA